jgi:hypothetical protein
MANFWRCDKCGVETTLRPKTEPILDENGKQKQGSLKRINPITREVSTIPVPLTRDLEPRTVIMSVKVGDETIPAKGLWDILEKVEPK